MSEYLPASPETIAEPLPPGARRTGVVRWQADAALLVNTVIWGTTFVVVQRALRDSSTLLFLFLRFTLAGLILAAFAREVRVDRRLVKASLLVGACLFLGYLFQTWGLLYTTPSRSGFITGFSIVLVPVFGAIVYRRFPGWGPALGVIFATAGMYLLTAPGGVGGINRGDVLTLMCAIVFAVHLLLIAHYSRLVPALGLAAGQVLVTAAFSLLALPWIEPIRFQPTPALLGALVLTALFATALAFFVQSWAQAFTTPTHAALIFAMEPVFASLTSFVLLHERIGLAGWIGGALILAGILAAELLSPRS